MTSSTMINFMIISMLIVEALCTLVGSLAASVLFGTLLVNYNINYHRAISHCFDPCSSFLLFAMTSINLVVAGGVTKR